MVAAPICVNGEMRRIVATMMLSVAVLAASAPVSQAGTRGPAVRLVALGDSYAAGVGASPDPTSGACLRSQDAYPALWAAEHRLRSFTFVACSGATTADVLADQVSAVTRSHTLVTITIGGNDIGFAPVLAGCTVARSDQDCATLVGGAEWLARYVLPVRLAKVYLTVRARAPHAKVVVLGYPRLFDPSPTCPNPLVPNAARRAVLNHGADVLDASIRSTAGALGLRYADVRDAFAGHGVCSAQPWIVAPTSVPPAPNIYHPNAAGYRDGYLPALDAAAGSHARSLRTAGR